MKVQLQCSRVMPSSFAGVYEKFFLIKQLKMGCSFSTARSKQIPYFLYLDIVRHRSLCEGVLSPLPTEREMQELKTLSSNLSSSAALVVTCTNEAFNAAGFE